MGFTKETFRFLTELEAHNDKAWFDTHRADYEAHWRDAALDVIASISDAMAALDPPLKAEPKINGTLRRINRDVRFSEDKSPYKARLHMIFWAGGHPTRSPAVHFVLHPTGVGYGAGQFGLEPKALAALRARIMDGPDGDALIAALERADTVGCRMGEPDLARLPKGFEADGRRAEILRHKSIVARTHDRDAATSNVIGPDATDWFMQTTLALLPLVRWLHKSARGAGKPV